MSNRYANSKNDVRTGADIVLGAGAAALVCAGIGEVIVLCDGCGGRVQGVLIYLLIFYGLLKGETREVRTREYLTAGRNAQCMQVF